MQYLQSVSLPKVVLLSDQATRQLEPTIRLPIYYSPTLLDRQNELFMGV